MLRHYGTPLPIDLLAGGSTPTATLVPGPSVGSITFSPASVQQVVKGDNWPCARGLGIKASTTFDQAASGGAAINWDELFRIFDSFNSNVPGTLGTMHSKDVFTGPVAKHVVEFRAEGGRNPDYARAQLVASDGDVAIVLYAYLPYTNENFIQPEAFWPWVGWLSKVQLQVNMAAATALAAVSTGAVVKTGTTLSAWIDAYVLPQPIRFLVSQWNRYQTTAAAGNTALLMTDVGQANGLNGALPGCRLAEVLELCTPLGLGGATTGDQFTEYSSNELGQDATQNPDAFMRAYLSVLGRNKINSNGATPGHDGAGNPNTLAATPNGALCNVASLYMPWRFSSRNQRLENCLKWAGGNITLNRKFSTIPSAGMHTVITNEIRDLEPAKRASLELAAGLAGVPVSILTDRPLRKGQVSGQAGVYQTRKS